MKRLTLTGLAALALAGCTLDPAYHRPGLPTDTAYPSTGAAYRADLAHQPAVMSHIPADLTGWRQVFTDPRLQDLISLALANNRDLRVALLNIAAAQAQYRSQRADLFPTLDATTDATLEGLPTSEAEPFGAASSSGSSAQTGTGHTIYRSYSAGVGFTSYELDVFGHVRSLTRSQFQQYLSEIATQRSTQISLVAEVATDYVTLLADQEQLTLAEDTRQSQARSYAITNAMFTAGTTTLLSLREAETSVDSARARIAQYTRAVAQDENALTLVVGTTIPADLPSGRDLVHQDIMADLPAGIPSDLLTQRPDIMAAEHTLLSANAQIGAARAAFLPSISLTASGGVASNFLNKLISPAAETWSFAPTITIPIFTWGQNEANLNYAKVQKRIDIADYEKTIETAFREVADGLAARGTYLDQLAAQQSLVQAYSDAYRLADLRFRTGADSFVTTLTTQQSLFQAEEDLISVKASQMQNLVTLYKALGGGWYADTPAAGLADQQ
jgi:multidrug efflux system outer membrane protein